MSPQRKHGNRAFPKGKAGSIPSIRALSWQCSLGPREKIGHYSLNSYPLEVAFSGIDRARRPTGFRVFIYFISHIFVLNQTRCS